MRVEANENTLLFPDGKSIKFDYPIKEFEEFENVFVVVLLIPAGHFMNENVFGISKEAEMLWQIERIPETSKRKGDYYVGISARGDATVRIANWSDVVVDVDWNTGKVINKREGRFV